jgi:very-short-patch-repair endonuclease
MGVEEPAFPGKAVLRAQVWRIVHAEDAGAGKVELPARVCRVLHVRATGNRGLAEAAAAQRSLVHLSQLRDLGISRGSYNHRLATGSLHRVLPSVLSVVHPLIELWAAETAGLLYAGDNAVLSHETAAALWGLGAIPSFVAITLIGRKVESQSHLRLHRVKGLDLRDLRHHQGFPVTAPARTLIDCATSPTIDRMLNEARVLKLVKNAGIQAALDRCPGRKGVAAMRALLKAEDDTGFTRSEAERILRRLIAAAKLEVPIFNTYVMGLEVDAHWPQYRLVVEVDGFAAHGHQAAFERDRGRDNRLIAAGYIVLRFTWRQLTHEPMVVLVTIVKALTVRTHTNLVVPKTVGSPLT